MQQRVSCLCINGSDSLGNAGIQADIRTIKDIGGYAVTVVTSVTVQNSQGIIHVHELPCDLIVGQVKAIYDEMCPRVVKVGMVNDAETIRCIAKEIVGSHSVVCSPVILSSYGGLLMSNDVLHAYCMHLLPMCTLLIIKCVDAEIILGRRISTDEDMKLAAEELHRMGAVNVLLRGGTYTEGRISALLSVTMETAEDGVMSLQNKGIRTTFFSSVNIDGWQRHGVGGVLSTAIAARMALGDDVEHAVNNAHNYLHSQVVYASSSVATKESGGCSQLQPNILYDRFMSLIADNYTTAHEVSFYAAKLCISTRYLSQITNMVCGRSPKQIIDEYIVRECEKLLKTTTLTIQQISGLLGFSSQISLAKFFKAKRGCSPSQCRNNI